MLSRATLSLTILFTAVITTVSVLQLQREEALQGQVTRDTYYWVVDPLVPPVNDSWHNPDNWDRGAVPGPNDNAVIQGSIMGVHISDGEAEVWDLTYDLGAMPLFVGDSLTVNGNFTIQGGNVEVTENVVVHGDFTLNGEGTYHNDGSTHIMGEAHLNDGKLLVGNGTVTFAGPRLSVGQELTITGGHAATGTINIEACFTTDTFVMVGPLVFGAVPLHMSISPEIPSGGDCTVMFDSLFAHWLDAEGRPDMKLKIRPNEASRSTLTGGPSTMGIGKYIDVAHNDAMPDTPTPGGEEVDVMDCTVDCICTDTTGWNCDPPTTCTGHPPCSELDEPPHCSDGGEFCGGSISCCDGNVQNNVDYGVTCCSGLSCKEGSCSSEGAEICGNGVKEGAEECDDGNTANGDACSATCTLPVTCVGNLVQNGSFEQGPDVPEDPGYVVLDENNTSITGWKVSEDPSHADVIDYAGAIWQCSHGDKCLDLDGTPEAGESGFGGIEQSFTTTPGASYSLTFDFAANPVGPPATKVMGLKIDGVEWDHDFAFTPSGNTTSNLGWRQESETFLASGPTTKIAFYSKNTVGGFSGPAIDNVCVKLASSPPSCGNGTKEGSEACDDGNTTNGDGCSATCTIESSGSCPSSLVSTGFDTNRTLLDISSCVSDPHWTVVETASQPLAGNFVSYTPNSSNSRHVSIACNGQGGDAIVRTFRTTFIMPAGADLNTYHITGQVAADDFVDDILVNGVSHGPVSSQGIFTPFLLNNGFGNGINIIDVKLRNNVIGQPGNGYGLRVEFDCPVCGDGIKEGGEGCDDGNTTNGDGCSSSCKLEGVSSCTGNLVKNGGFEAGADVGVHIQNATSSHIDDWTVLAPIDYVGTLWQPASGQRSVDMSGSPGAGRIQQTIATEAGKQYNVRFALAGNPQGGMSPNKYVKVIFGSQEEARIPFDTTGKSLVNMGWVQKEYTFTASSQNTVLEFSSHIADGYGSVIDDVCVLPATGPTCNNNTKEDTETCDGTDLDGQTCLSQGFEGGTLACANDCSAFDTSGCFACGDGTINGAEDCEGANLGGETCVSQGFAGGTLTCSSSCAFDLSNCVAPTSCGDSVKNGTEQCDGPDLDAQTCSTQGFDGGNLSCASNCAFDTSQCYACGDGELDPSEDCDGSNLNGETCLSKGFAGGTLACTSSCTFDLSDCDAPPTCGDNEINGSEECDGSDLDGETCFSQGFDEGTLACAANCSFDTSDCAYCGDAVIGGTEECDGANLNGETCVSQGFDTGTLGCTIFCRFDTTNCTATSTHAECEEYVGGGVAGDWIRNHPEYDDIVLKGYRCKEVPGSGTNQCDLNATPLHADCQPDYHMKCLDKTCVPVKGTGTNECTEEFSGCHPSGPHCGDGEKNTPEEECDDGNDTDTDACRNDCTKPACGDDVVSPLGADGIAGTDDDEECDFKVCEHSNKQCKENDDCAHVIQQEVTKNSVCDTETNTCAHDPAQTCADDDSCTYTDLVDVQVDGNCALNASKTSICFDNCKLAQCANRRDDDRGEDLREDVIPHIDLGGAQYNDNGTIVFVPNGETPPVGATKWRDIPADRSCYIEDDNGKYTIPAPYDDDEKKPLECEDDWDNDGDGFIDFKDLDQDGDFSCTADESHRPSGYYAPPIVASLLAQASPPTRLATQDDDELYPYAECSDGDDEHDGKTNMDDPECSDPRDNDESPDPIRNPARGDECSDGEDNDGDGLTDRDDPTCSDYVPLCNDGNADPWEECGEPGLACPTGETCHPFKCQCQDSAIFCGNGTQDTLTGAKLRTLGLDRSITIFTEECGEPGLSCTGAGACDLSTCACKDAVRFENECEDDLDNDHDGLIDNNDPGCVANSKDREAPIHTQPFAGWGFGVGPLSVSINSSHNDKPRLPGETINYSVSLYNHHALNGIPAYVAFTVPTGNTHVWHDWVPHWACRSWRCGVVTKKKGFWGKLFCKIFDDWFGLTSCEELRPQNGGRGYGFSFTVPPDFKPKELRFCAHVSTSNLRHGYGFYQCITIPHCIDFLDNDGDGLVDFEDPGCKSPQDGDESDDTSQCQNGDNDLDGFPDYPEDECCDSPQDNTEDNSCHSSSSSSSSAPTCAAGTQACDTISCGTDVCSNTVTEVGEGCCVCEPDCEECTDCEECPEREDCNADDCGDGYPDPWEHCGEPGLPSECPNGDPCDMNTCRCEECTGPCCEPDSCPIACVPFFSRCSCSTICIENSGEPPVDCDVECPPDQIDPYQPDCGYDSSGVCRDLASNLCGNGFLDPGEECDDGNLASGDCCSVACLIEEGCQCTLDGGGGGGGGDGGGGGSGQCPDGAFCSQFDGGNGTCIAAMPRPCPAGTTLTNVGNCGSNACPGTCNQCLPNAQVGAEPILQSVASIEDPSLVRRILSFFSLATPEPTSLTAQIMSRPLETAQCPNPNEQTPDGVQPYCNHNGSLIAHPVLCPPDMDTIICQNGNALCTNDAQTSTSPAVCFLAQGGYDSIATCQNDTYQCPQDNSPYCMWPGAFVSCTSGQPTCYSPNLPQNISAPVLCVSDDRIGPPSSSQSSASSAPSGYCCDDTTCVFEFGSSCADGSTMYANQAACVDACKGDSCGDGICTANENLIICVDPPPGVDPNSGNYGCFPVCADDCTGSSSAASSNASLPGPSICSPICGDELVVFPETCDDGNTVSGDGCSEDCRQEGDDDDDDDDDNDDNDDDSNDDDDDDDDNDNNDDDSDDDDDDDDNDDDSNDDDDDDDDNDNNDDDSDDDDDDDDDNDDDDDDDDNNDNDSTWCCIRPNSGFACVSSSVNACTGAGGSTFSQRSACDAVCIGANDDDDDDDNDDNSDDDDDDNDDNNDDDDFGPGWCCVEDGFQCLLGPSHICIRNNGRFFVHQNTCSQVCNVADDDDDDDDDTSPRLAFCGNGLKDRGEDCDEGAANSDILPNTCRLNCSAPRCGDRVVDAGERCDDGNRIPGDGCDASCRLEVGCDSDRDCARGRCIEGSCVPCTDDTECLEGICLNGQCVADQVCGNGTKESGEQCDDGNTLPGDGCSAACTSERTQVAAQAICGNGVIDPGEECDDSNQRDFDGCSADCLREHGTCGDRIVQRALGEQCEPATHDSRLPYRCTAQCRYLSLTCGDGRRDPGEECDAGNLNSDLPNARCRSDCGLPRCGDSILDRNETCDDGNRLPDDGCSRLCQRELTAAFNYQDQQAPWSQQPASQPSPFANLSLWQLQQLQLQQQQFGQPWQSAFPGVQPLPPGTLPVASIIPQRPGGVPYGDTGPAAVAFVAVGAGAGLAWVRRRRR